MKKEKLKTFVVVVPYVRIGFVQAEDETDAYDKAERTGLVQQATTTNGETISPSNWHVEEVRR